MCPKKLVQSRVMINYNDYLRRCHCLAGQTIEGHLSLEPAFFGVGTDDDRCAQALTRRLGLALLCCSRCPNFGSPVFGFDHVFTGPSLA